MSQTTPEREVTITVVLRGPYINMVQNPMTRAITLLSAIEQGATDWYCVARDAYSDCKVGCEVAMTVSWPCGHSLWAVFDCSDPHRPTITALHMTEDDSIPIDTGDQCEGIYTSSFVTARTFIDFSHRDVFKVFAERLADGGHELLSKVCEMNAKAAHQVMPADLLAKARRIDRRHNVENN